MAKFGIGEQTYQKLRQFFATQPEIEQVIIYGSRARNTHKAGSDIDFCFKGENLTRDKLDRIAVQLDELDTPYFYDLSLYRSLEEPFLTEIDRTGQIFYSD